MSDDGHRTADEILQDLLAGDLQATAAEARELFARDPLARQRWQTLQQLTDQLGAAGLEQRADLADDPVGVPAPGSELVAAVVRQGASGSPSTPERNARPRWRLPALLVTAAAAVALAVTLWNGDEGHAGGDAIQVLGGEPGQLHPVGDVPDYRVFTWNLPAEPGGWFAVTVVDDTDAGRGRPVAESPELEAQTWSPEDDTTRWPDAIRWEVSAYDALGTTVAGDGGRARRVLP